MDAEIEEQREEEENKIAFMQTAKSSPCDSPAARTSTVLEPESTDRRQDSPVSVRALSSLSSDGLSKTRTVAIAIEAHSRYEIDPFIYAFDNLVEQKVVVISCLSRLRDESEFKLQKAASAIKYVYRSIRVGLDRCIDVHSFAGVNMRKLEAAVKTQINNLNYFLRAFRDKLNERGVEFAIQVSTGPKSLDILVQAAKALHPHWLILDCSFSSQKKKIQAALECNLVLMKKSGIPPEILQVSPGYQVHDETSDEDLKLSSYPRTISRTPSSNSKAGAITRLRSFLRNQNSIRETVSSSKVIPRFTDGVGGADELDGPRKDQTVLYSEIAGGSHSGYLGKEGQVTQQVPILLFSRSIRASPTASPTSSTRFNFWSTSTTKRSNEKSRHLLDQEEVDSQTGFSTSSSGSLTSMAECQENFSFGMTPTGMVEYTSIRDSEHVKKQGDDVPCPRTPGSSEGTVDWSDDDTISRGG